MADTCVRPYTLLSGYYVGNSDYLPEANFVVAIYCYHGDGRHVCTKCHGHTHYYQATMLVIVINCLRLFVFSIFVTMAMKHSAVKGMCVQSITTIRTTISNIYAAMLEMVLYSLRLFVVGGEHVAMAMVVVGHICTQNMVVHNSIYKV